MATSYKRLPKWDGDSWDGRLPAAWAESQQDRKPPPPRPTEEQSAALLDSDAFTPRERSLIHDVAKAALGPQGEFSDVFDARRVAFVAWLRDNQRLDAKPVSDEDLDRYLASLAESQDESM